MPSRLRLLATLGEPFEMTGLEKPARGRDVDRPGPDRLIHPANDGLVVLQIRVHHRDIRRRRREHALDDG